MRTARVGDKVKGGLLSRWWAQRVVFKPGALTPAVDLWRDYVATVGKAHAFGPQAFSRALEARGVHARKSPAGKWLRMGVWLKDSAEAAMTTTPLDNEPEANLGVLADDVVRRIARFPPPDDMLVRGTIAAPIAVPLQTYKFEGGTVTFAGKSHPLESLSLSVGAGETLSFPADTVFKSPEPAVWNIAPYAPGDPHLRGILLDIGDDCAGEASARVALELYQARRGQARKEGEKVQPYTAADDDALPPGELASMAAAFAYASSLPDLFTGWLRGRAPGPGRDLGGVHVLGIVRALWLRSMETFSAASPRAMLVKAGGLIIAAIETIDRAEARKAKQGEA